MSAGRGTPKHRGLEPGLHAAVTHHWLPHLFSAGEGNHREWCSHTVLTSSVACFLWTMDASSLGEASPCTPTQARPANEKEARPDVHREGSNENHLLTLLRLPLPSSPYPVGDVQALCPDSPEQRRLPRRQCWAQMGPLHCQA